MSNLLPVFLRSEGNVTDGVRKKGGDSCPSSDEFEPMTSLGKKPAARHKRIATSQKSNSTSGQKTVPPVVAPSLSDTESPTTAGPKEVDLTKSDNDTDSVSLQTLNRSGHPVLAATARMGNVEDDTGTQGALIRTYSKAPKEHAIGFDQEDVSSRDSDTAARSPSVDPILDATPLPDNHPPKFLQQARVQFTNERPPFVRLKRSRNEGKIVTLAAGHGRLPKSAVLARLVTRDWDSKASYYTLDRNGERLIVKPIGTRAVHGKRGGHPYREWSGWGNSFADAPVAFAFNGDIEEQPDDRNDVGNDLESGLGQVSNENSDSEGDEEHLSTSSESSGFEGKAQQGLESQQPRATRGYLARLDAILDDGHTRCPRDASRTEDGPASRSATTPLHPSPPGPSTAPQTISEIAAGKRPASETIDNGRAPKRVRPLGVSTSVNSSTTGRIPPSLTIYKQERTTLHVLLPGSTSDIVPVKLRSAMTMATLFSTVATAAGVRDDERMAVAVVLGGEDGGQERNIIVKRNMMDTFEFFLEVVDEAKCWEEEGGRMALQLQLRWPFEGWMAG